MNRRWFYALAGITIVGAIVRFATLGVQSYDHDEAVTAARVLHPSLFDTLSVVAHGERSPPLYYVLGWGWSRVFGTGEVGLRSLSALIGTLTVPLAYLAAKELINRRTVALLAAALVALNPYLVWYSQEARSYALMVLFASAALLYFARSLKRPSPGSLALWALASALAICSHYFAAFLIAPEAVWLLLGSTRRRQAAVAVAGVAIAGLALIPLAVTQEGAGRRNGFTDIALTSRLGELSLNFVAGQEPAPFAGTRLIDALQLACLVGGAAIGALAIVLLVRLGCSEERRAAVVAAVVGGGAVAVPILLAVVGIDFINPRNLIGALVPLLIFLAIGLGVRRSRWLGALGVAGACLMFAVVLAATNLSAQMQRPDWRGAADALEAATPEPKVFVVPRNGDDPLRYYLDAEKPHKGKPPRVSTPEIAVLSTNYHVTPPPKPFKLTQKEGLAPAYVLWRYTAPRSRPVHLGDLTGNQVLSERSTVLFRSSP
jgi:4-amino-4-deoxy-L-arabinose transferase-like glycosyltransferase